MCVRALPPSPRPRPLCSCRVYLVCGPSSGLAVVWLEGVVLALGCALLAVALASARRIRGLTLSPRGPLVVGATVYRTRYISRCDTERHHDSGIVVAQGLQVAYVVLPKVTTQDYRQSRPAHAYSLRSLAHRETCVNQAQCDKVSR